jgi:hypothetical protein
MAPTSTGLAAAVSSLGGAALVLTASLGSILACPTRRASTTFLAFEEIASKTAAAASNEEMAAERLRFASTPIWRNLT